MTRRIKAILHCGLILGEIDEHRAIRPRHLQDNDDWFNESQKFTLRFDQKTGSPAAVIFDSYETATVWPGFVAASSITVIFSNNPLGTMNPTRDDDRVCYSSIFDALKAIDSMWPDCQERLLSLTYDANPDWKFDIGRIGDEMDRRRRHREEAAVR